MPPATGVDEMYIDNIDEFIEDESRIVTYKWLSLTLQVHVNTAKKMLWEFVRRAREEKPKVALHVTYLVSGVSTLDGLPCHKVSVVREEELESAKAQLSLLASVHVYSVQRARLLDSGVLYMADYDIIRDNLHQSSRFSSIQYSRGVARSTEEMQALRSQATSTQEPADPLDGPLAAPAAPPAAPPAATNGQCAPKAAPRAAAPKGIMGMFAGKGGGSKEVKKESPAPEPVKEKPAAASSKAPVKVSIFASAAKAKPKEEIKTEVKACVSTEEAKQAKVDDTRGNSSGRVKRPKVSDSEDEEEKKVVAAVESKHAGKKGTGNAGKRAAVRDGKKRGASPEAKKRKRIRQPVSDSSSSSGDDDDDDKDEEQEAPSPPTIGTPPLPEVTEHQQDKIGSEKTGEANKSGARRKRRRVLKSKTFLDDEGSMVTEKDWVSESCTDSEGEFQPATKKAPTVPVPQKAAQKTEGGKGKDKKTSQQSKLGKQTSIMGFFQKK
ncbi:DNA polymerase delta subunit 3 isoform X2 [Lethenteron reissneri]|uniref:DNA polymerase delta subunit 3 isoform X2 n=1 Tax=Lethenteron reissneri TaxID=7753 RepID=UPI002AB74877|nr:DNA polymerase delta subunit 3 isoform X2 [Lethenteron reissneri]